VKGDSVCRRTFGPVVALSFGLTSASPARAEQLDDSGNGRFVLDVTQCPKSLTEGARRFIGIEVGDLLYEDAARAPAGADTLTIRCSGNLAVIEAAGVNDAAPLEKIFNLEDFPGDAAPRALALASLELMAVRNSTVRERIDNNRNATQPEPKPVAMKPSAPATATPVTQPRKSAASSTETRVGLAAVGRMFPAKHGPLLWGGQLQTSTVFDRLWRFSADGELSAGENKVSLGRTRALLLTGGATLGMQGRRGVFDAGVGLGARLGVVRLSGSPADSTQVAAATVWRPWGGPLLAAGLSASFGRVALTLAAETGLPLLEPQGQAGNTTAIALDGPWAAIAVGANIRL
jgi:hypothetical protein